MSLIRRDRRWGLDPFQEVSRLEDEMRNLFTNVFGDRELSRSERIFAPLVDVRELEDKFIIEADIPGFKKDDIAVDVTAESVELTANHSEEKKEEKEGQYLRQERCAFKFYRAISLPTPIDTEKIKSSFNDGTLTLELPKAPGTGKKRLAL